MILCKSSSTGLSRSILDSKPYQWVEVFPPLNLWNYPTKMLTGKDIEIYKDENPKQPALPTVAADRKALPIATGVLDYFPLALIEVAKTSKAGNDQHNPGQPLHWAKHLSTDHADSLMRHLLERGTIDTDGIRHTAKVAWRALALLQTELENDQNAK